jgi:FMN-dependent NADH-azoreductase
MKLLHVDSSIIGGNSVSRVISAAIVARLREASGGTTVTYRDLAAEPLPHLSGAYLAAAAAPGEHTAALQHDLALGSAVMEEFLAADTVVIGAPMYNFTIPSQLKAWIDRIVLVGKTVRYTEKGPEGLAGDKRVIVAISRGGFYGAGMPAAALDFQENFLRGIFGFIGVTNAEFIRAEGVAIGPDQRQQALASAHAAAAALEAA